MADPERRERFLREARTAAAVSHPAIATIHEVGEDAGIVFIALELVEGRTLRELVSAGPLPVRDAVRIATEIAEGLESADKSGVVHRDLKPENVMVRADGRVKVLDFGLAKPVEEPRAADRGKLSHAGHTPGSHARASWWGPRPTCRPSRCAGRSSMLAPRPKRAREFGKPVRRAALPAAPS